MNVTDFSLSEITMVKCRVQRVDRGFFEDLYVPYFALHISKVNISFLFITNSTQIGLLCINLLVLHVLRTQ